MAFSNKERDRNLNVLEREFFDLVIIGGGITGAGIARDASSRGMKVALVEAGDFAVGTSSRSSKLIHGGLRYLENFEFSLVFEALRERALLFKMAPHLVHPLRFIVPVYKDSRVGYWKMLAGLWLYDLLALFETPEPHESLSSDEVKKRVPDIELENLVGALEYSDAYTDDDRLVIETLRDAHRRGAVISHYTRMLSARRQTSGLVEWIQVSDELTGKSFRIRGRQYVSGVGPWTDILGKTIDKKWQSKLRLTKGIHLVFPKETIPLKKAVVMAARERIIFVIPRQEMVIVGTTDTDYRGDPAEAFVNARDVDYLLKALHRYFPRLKICVNDMISSYCGVRPLVRDGSAFEGKTSREYSLFTHGPNLNFVAGGKYTTYRRISEEVVDRILRRMNFERAMGFGVCRTSQALNPKLTPSLYERIQHQIPEIAGKYSCHEKTVETLVKRHGEEALWIIEKIKSLWKNSPPHQALWMGEAAFAIRETMCLNLVDFYWRRTPLFLSFRDHGLQFISSISKVFSDYYGWDRDELKQQQNRLQEQIQKELAWKNFITERWL